MWLIVNVTIFFNIFFRFVKLLFLIETICVAAVFGTDLLGPFLKLGWIPRLTIISVDFVLQQKA